MKELLACSRIYNASPRHMQAWEALFTEVSRMAQIPLRVTPWAPPRPVTELWRRDDLGLAFICGRPYLQAGARHQIVAAPKTVEAGSRTAYRSLFLSRSNAPFSSLARAFGSRMGHLPPHSQSGYNAPRFVLAGMANGSPCFSQCRIYETPMECIRALLSSQVDVISLDSYFYSLLQGTSVDVQAMKIIAESPETPMPFLAASPEVDPETVGDLRKILAILETSPAFSGIFAELAITGFSFPSPAEYAVLATQEAAALQQGYPCIK